MSEREDATIDIRVIPRAARDKVGGERAGRLLVRVTAPPADGRANACLCAAIAARLGVAKGHVEVVRGASARDKTVRVRGIAANDRRLAALWRES